MLKKIVSFVLAAALVLTAVWNFDGGAKEVQAGSGDMYIHISIDGGNWAVGTGTSVYSTWFKNNELLVEFGDKEQKKEDVFVLDKKTVENACKEHGGTPKVVIVSDRIYKYGERIKITKDDYKVNKYGMSEIKITVVTDRINNMWYEGFWLDSNGDNSYSGYGQWYGSGAACWYQDTNGWYPVSSWTKIDGNWYYFDENGYALYNGWYQVDGSWYYFDDRCLYELDAWRDGYYINSDGTQTYAYTGSWNSDSTGWWYSDTSGWYATTWAYIDGTLYYFKSDGYMASNEWVEMTDAPATDNLTGYTYYYWYYFDSNGQIEKIGNYDKDGKWIQVNVND